MTDVTAAALGTLEDVCPEAARFASVSGLRFLQDGAAGPGWAFHDHVRFGAFAALPSVGPAYALHECAHVAWWFLDLDGRRRCVEAARREGALVLAAAAGAVRGGMQGAGTAHAEQVLCSVDHLARRFPSGDPSARLDDVPGFWGFSDACWEIWARLGRRDGGVSSAIGLVVLAEASRHLGLEPDEGPDLLFEEACATLAGADLARSGAAGTLRRALFDGASPGFAAALEGAREAARAAWEWLSGAGSPDIDLDALACQGARWARTGDGVPCLAPMGPAEWAADRAVFEDARLVGLVGPEAFRALRLGRGRDRVEIPGSRPGGTRRPGVR